MNQINNKNNKIIPRPSPSTPNTEATDTTSVAITTNTATTTITTTTTTTTENISTVSSPNPITTTTTTTTTTSTISTGPPVNGMKPKKSLSKQLRDAAGKQGKAEEVRQLIESAGDDFPSLVEVGTTGNFTKNALHLAAWKGDLQSILYLVETGRKPAFDLDLINIISTGEGNYGKTPIFYAITQDRDDAVNLLLDLNANLLIVNNKGQTPCSMAVAHLSPETCQRMFEIEQKQLEEGGLFKNYRESHSDRKRYGDLDPRFGVDKDNWVGDIEKELKDIYKILNGDDHPSVHENYDDKDGWKQVQPLDINVYQKSYPTLVPRSLRPTTPEIRRAKFERCAKAKKLMKEELKPHKKNEKIKKAVEIPKELVVDIDSLDCLRITDLIKKGSGDDIESCFTLVNDFSGLTILSQVVHNCMQSLYEQEMSKEVNGDKHQTESDHNMVNISWGLDCEWKPVFETGQDNPVATLQLSTADHAFLVDVQSLCQPEIKSANVSLTDVEDLLSRTLTQIFANDKIPIVGFGIGQDLNKLCASFPHMPCFRFFESVIDLHMIARNIFNQTPKHYMSSLQKTVGVLLEKRLDKTQQCSMWDVRPLDSSQLEYAVLDAVVLPRLLLKMASHPLAREKLDNIFFRKNPHLRSSIRLTVLDNDSSPENDEIKTTYRVKMGSLKEILSVRIARQTWATGKKQPELPEIIPIEILAEQNSARGNRSRKEKRAAKKAFRSSVRTKSVNLITIPGDLDSVPSPGTFLGYTKDSCIHRVLGSRFMDALPEGTRLGYNRRGGVFQLRNAWILFINLAGGVQVGKYRNDFINDGKQITFTVNPSNPSEAALIDHFLSIGESYYEIGVPSQEDIDISKEEKEVFLFLRPGTNSKFLYCGKCSCSSQSTHEQGGIILELILQDYETMISDGEDGKNSSYCDIAASHSESLRQHDMLNGRLS